MPHNHSNKADQPIRCISCGKIIGQGFIVEGSIQLLCKCGVKTKIEAEKKPEGRCDYPKVTGVVMIHNSLLKRTS